jgi:hypothetical protein
MRNLFCILTIVLCAAAAFGQNQTADKQALKFPQFNGAKPRIELPKALKTAEKFIKKQKIDVSNYYLARVHLISYGEKENRRLIWFFRWVNVDGTVGDYIEVGVFMDGTVKRI